ncbi:hypothetical protein [Chamaesiphon sp.]|uniref:hypothetical protein n=1 Tax=Chamaesiphon sp. TaxID=2814140 RepID=UPI0035944976
MIRHRYSQFSLPAISRLVHPKLSTGSGFGCSTLGTTVRRPELVSPLTSSTASGATDLETVGVGESSQLIIEVGKIALLACWLWCAIGANFCRERIDAIATYAARDL